MNFIQRNAKRIAIDTAGYLLCLVAIAISWLPGPGAIPLALVGLGLLSINNAWAKNLRELLREKSGDLAKVLFPKLAWVQAAYDVLAVIMLVVVVLLIVDHQAIWEISFALFLFFAAIFIGLMNRDRLQQLRK